MNLAHAFLQNLQAQGESVAVVEPNGKQVSYRDLYDQIRGFTALLHAKGFEPGDAVVIQVPNGIAFTVATVSVLAAGGVAVLCEPGLGDEVYFSRLKAAKARWVVVHPLILWVNRIPGARNFLAKREQHVPPIIPNSVVSESIVLSNGRLKSMSTGAGEIAIADRSKADDAIVIFTGGTTSMPKGVRLSHGALTHYLGNIAGIADEIEITRFLADTPQQVLYALNLGKSVLVTKGRTQKRAAFVLRAIREGKIDAYFGSPFLWVEMMAQSGGNRERLPDTLHAVLLGGAPVTPEFLRKLREWLHPDTKVMAIYGLTESGPVCVATDEEKLTWDGEGDFVGKPLSGARLELNRDDGAEVGEVIVHSNSLYTGYIGQPDRPASEGLSTGDLGRLVARNGGEALVLLGRQKDMIIRASVNVYPGTLEPVLRDIRDGSGATILRECALIGLWNDDRQDEDIVLCYEPVAGLTISEENLRKSVEGVTGEDAAPDHYLEVRPIPVTGRQNKIDKADLRNRAAAAFGLAARLPDHAER